MDCISCTSRVEECAARREYPADRRLCASCFMQEQRAYWALLRDDLAEQTLRWVREDTQNEAAELLAPDRRPQRPGRRLCMRCMDHWLAADGDICLLCEADRARQLA